MTFSPATILLKLEARRLILERRDPVINKKIIAALSREIENLNIALEHESTSNT